MTTTREGVELEMRRILPLAAALATFAVVGIAAAAKPAAVSISAARSAVTYGGSVKLSGTVSNHQSGEHVLVMGRPYAVTTYTQVGSADTTAKGVWTFTASPQIGTSYKATWNAVMSRAVTVKVRPRITLALSSRTARRGTFTVEVDGARSFSGKYVLVQRLTLSGPVTVKHVVLGASSAATFTIRLPRHRARVRIVMPSSQAAPGYITGYSNVWKST
jgi:hypothetical protein